MFIKVFVTPSAKRERVEDRTFAKAEVRPAGPEARVGEQPQEMLAIAVKEPAQGNHANTRVRQLIALRLSVPIGRVRILTGHRSRSKIVSISD